MDRRSAIMATSMPPSSQAALKALAEPRRVAMLRLVRDRPRSVGEIAGHFDDITQQAVSQHLRELREAGLVAVHKDGQRRLYMLRPEGIEGLESFLRDLWPSGIDRLHDGG
jgi:DNA-binding transcriptional ArsR family regulator